jgi:hypothetical protein
MSSPIKPNKMKKTKTGLHIDVKDKRIKVYTEKELQKIREKEMMRDDIVIVFTLSGLLICIGILIGISL